MIRGLPASVLLHVAVIGAGYIAWPYVASTVATDEFVVVPVELVDVGEVTNVAPVTSQPEEPEEEPEVEAPEPEPVEEDVPVEEEPDDRDLPEDDIETAQEAAPPEQEDDVLPDLKAEAEPEEKEPVEKPKPEQKKTPNPKEKANPMDDFLKSAESTFQSERQTKKKTQPPKTEERKERPSKPQEEARAGAGERTANTVRIEMLLYNQIEPCWIGVSDQPEPERLNVTMKAKLDIEGNLLELKLENPSRVPIGDRSMQLAIDRALLAVRKCQPFNLPKDDYDLWDDATINLGAAFGRN